MTWTKALPLVLLAMVLATTGETAWAAQPQPWQTGFQPSASSIMADIDKLHDLLLVIIASITVFVLGLLLYAMIRFRAGNNPVPSKTSHHTVIEVIWTALPIMILVVIAVPSFNLLYYADIVPKSDLTIKAIGHQWYWSYEYPDHGNFTFDALMVATSDLKPGQPRLLETDNRVVIPVNATVRMQITAADVLHAWALPAFGVKKDGVPGRLNEIWFKADREGVYYGQCSELCGTNHGFMPIAVEVVSQDAFAKWVVTARKKFARTDAPAAELADSAYLDRR